MAGASSEKTIYTYDKRAKDKVRKSGDSAKGKAVQLGEVARVFSTVVYFNPTHGRLDGAIHVPEGQSIPDVNGFLAELLNGLHSTSRRRDPQRARMRHQPAQATQGGGGVEIDAADVSHYIAADRNSAASAGYPKAGHGGTLTATRDSDNETQRNRGMGNDWAVRGASRAFEHHEMADGAVADGVGGHDTSIRMFDVGRQDVFEMEEAGNKVQTGRSKNVSHWQVVMAKNAEAPTAQVARAGSAGNQARIVQRFLRQVSLRMRLATRQERLPLHRIAHQAR
ncbi:patatin-like serine hydrolase [Colletotrichum incanum]|uniref:Patatin-like serine hydrolase n=1 Tax=Colletotrichum incanum TaxID=1573173 RepID=A0A167E341_COLIC|nr:patatin-like serine hydrolase [Colletotrichum incanum]